MNDFTKEELEELLRGYVYHQHNTRHNWPSIDLSKKIEDMINTYDAKVINAWHCEKCGHVQ